MSGRRTTNATAVLFLASKRATTLFTSGKAVSHREIDIFLSISKSMQCCDSLFFSHDCEFPICAANVPAAGWKVPTRSSGTGDPVIETICKLRQYSIRAICIYSIQCGI